MKRILHNIPIFLVIFFCCIACEKIKYKDDFRAPLLGKYKCNVEVLTKNVRCYDHELIHKEKLNQFIHIVDNSFIEVGPSYYYPDNSVHQNRDKLEYAGKFLNGIDTFYTFDNFYSMNAGRTCVLRISKDSFYFVIDQNCEFGYNISGKR